MQIKKNLLWLLVSLGGMVSTQGMADTIKFHQGLSFQVLEQYSAVNVFVGTFTEPGNQNSLRIDAETRIVDRGGPVTRIDETIYLTTSYGSIDTVQSGRLQVNGSAGKARLIGGHNATIQLAAGEPRFARSEGKHVLLAEFTVPDFGSSETDIAFLFDFVSSSQGQALFLIEGDLDPNFMDVDFGPKEYTSWRGIAEDTIRKRAFKPGEIISFALGIEPGTGVSTTGVGPFSGSFSDFVDVKFDLRASSPATVPLPATLPLMVLALGIGMIIKGRRLLHS